MSSETSIQTKISWCSDEEIMRPLQNFSDTEVLKRTLEHLSRKGKVYPTDLQEYLECSRETALNYLEELEENDIVKICSKDSEEDIKFGVLTGKFKNIY